MNNSDEVLEKELFTLPEAALIIVAPPRVALAESINFPKLMATDLIVAPLRGPMLINGEAVIVCNPVEVPVSIELIEAENIGSVENPVSTNLEEEENNSLIGSSKADFFSFSYYPSLQAALRDRLADSKLRLFNFLILAMLIGKFMFGAIGIATMLSWFSIMVIITVFQQKNQTFHLKSGKDGLELTQTNSFGLTRTLQIDWDNVSSVEKVYDQQILSNFLITLKSRPSTKVLESVLFFEEFIDYQNQFSIPLRDFTKEKIDDLQAMFDSECPHFLLKSINADALNSAQTELLGFDSNALLLPYQPLANYRSSIQKIVRFGEKYLTLPLTLAAAYMVINNGAFNYASMLFTVLVPLFTLAALFTQEKLSFAFDGDGITTFWLTMKASHKSKAIPWESVKFVSVLNSKTGEPTAVLIHLDARNKSISHLGFFRFLKPDVFKYRNSDPFIQIDLQGIKDPHARVDLLSTLRRHLENEQIEPELDQVLNPTDPHSYTQLWIDTLGKTTTRRLDANLSPGHHLNNGEFEIERFLGAGGQANVYLAKQKDGDDTYEIVLKEFILPSHAGAELSQRSVDHIHRELELMQRVEHPNIVEYHDIFVEDHRCYLVLEHIEGRTLRTIVEESGALEEKQVRELAKQMATILDHLHSQESPIVHRDFTPENLILNHEGVLKLIDFNVAQELEEGATRTIVGKHNYLPPEQFRGKATPQSDIYAFGATLYFLLTAEEPEPISCSHPILKNENISADLDTLVSAATELELDDRIESAEEVLQRLETFDKASMIIDTLDRIKSAADNSDSDIDDKNGHVIALNVHCE